MATFLGNRYSHYRNSGTNTPLTESLPSSPNSVWDDWRFRADIYLESQSISTNTSEVKIYFYIEHKERSNYNTTLPGWNAPQASYGNISINGNWKQISKSVTLNVGKNATAWTTYSDSELIGSVTRTIYHNADGTGSFTTQCYGRLWVGQEALYTSNGSYTLPTIPRYATINSFTFEKASGVEGLSRLTCGWSVSNTCDAVEYSLSGGGWTSSGTSGTSGSFNISWLTPNTQYSLRIRVKRTDSQLWTESGTIYQTTYDYARVTGADSINDEGSPYMTFTNPSGAVINVRLEGGSQNIQRNNISNVGAYTFILTTDERNMLRATIPNASSMTLRYVIATVVGGNETYWTWLDRVFTIINANPTFTTFTYEDINATTTALTGNNQIIVKGYSSLRGIVTTANKMVAIKGATAKEYQLAVTGSTPVKANYSSSSTVNLDIGVVSNNVFITNAIDSRNNATAVTVNASTYKEYFNVTKGAIADNTIARTGNVSKETTLKLKGTFWNASFGNVTNDFVNAKYRYKDTDDEDYSAYTNITLTKNGNEFSYNSKIAGDDGASGFLIENSYNVQVLISDKLSSVTYDFILGTGTPNISVHKDGIALKGLYDTNLGGALQVNGSLTLNNSSDELHIQKEGNDIVKVATSGITLISPPSDATDKRIVFRPKGVSDATSQVIVGENGFYIEGTAINLRGNCSVFAKTDTQSIPATTETTVKFNSTYVNDGNCFELLADGTIKVLANITRVLVTINIRTSGVGNIIYVRSSISDGFNAVSEIGDDFLNGSGIVQVQQNAIISLTTYFYSAGTIIGYDRNWCGVNIIVLK